MFFGLYGGIRDGGKFVFARFHYVGLITAIGTSVVVFLVSFGIAHWFWTPEEYRDTGFVLAELNADDLNPFVLGAVFVSTWLLFVSGALVGTALQFWASEKEHAGRASSSASVVRAQAWLGFAGTVLAALIALFGTLVGGQ